MEGRRVVVVVVAAVVAVIVVAVAAVALAIAALARREPSRAPVTTATSAAHDADAASPANATRAVELPAPSTMTADARTTDAPADRTQAASAGRLSHFLARLPDDDRAWVIAEGAAALARGQVDLATLPAYVDQLASVHELAVVERTQRYLNPEAMR